jgi:protoheme IX farnesyltransferase
MPHNEGIVSTTRAAILPALSRPAAYLALTKPDVSFLVVLTTAAGYYLGTRGPLDVLRMAHTVFGTTLVAAGTSALNQYFERASDSRMRRTAARPLPSGVLAPPQAFWFGAGLALAGALYLVLAVGALPSLLALATCVSYLGAYTPLKTRTTLCTLVGAFPGAVPPLIGWAAARGSLSVEAWILYGILFLWQFPHFHAIAWMYREDYTRAGIQMLPVHDRSGVLTFRQIVWTAMLLLPVSLLAAVVGLAGVRYFFGAIVLGLALVQVCLWAARAKTNVRAKWLMHATVLHLPLLLGLMMFDKVAR